MSNFKYFLESNGSTPNPDRPPALVIQVESITVQTLEQLPIFLIEHVDLIHDIEGIETHLDARPIIVEHKSGFRISERLIWMMALECLPHASNLIVKYVESHLNRIGEDGNLGWCSYLDIVGQEALYAYFDSLDEDVKCLQAHLEIIDCFMHFYKRCDLEHYYLPSRYVVKILDDKDLDLNRFNNLLYYYISNDQWALENYEQMHIYLSKDGVLKKIVDMRIHEGDLESGWGMLVILQFCAPVYGNIYKLTSRVLDYCKEKFDGFGCDDDSLKSFQSGLNRTRGKCDADWASRNIGSKYSSVNTGFHKYDGETDVWIEL